MEIGPRESSPTGPRRRMGVGLSASEPTVEPLSDLPTEPALALDPSAKQPRRAPPSILCTLCTGLIPFFLLGSIVAFRTLLSVLRGPSTADPDIFLPPKPCPDLLYLEAPDDAVAALWRGRDTQYVARSPTELGAALCRNGSLSCSFLILPLTSRDAPLLSNWVRFAAAVRPPLAFAVMPLDEDARRAVLAEPRAAVPPGTLAATERTETAESDAPAPGALPPMSSDVLAGSLYVAAPVVYLPFGDELLAEVEVSVGLARVPRSGANLSAEERALAAAKDLSHDALVNILRYYLGRLARGVADALKWRAVAGILGSRAWEGLDAARGEPAVAIGDAATVLFSNPLPLLTTLPRVRQLCCQPC